MNQREQTKILYIITLCIGVFCSLIYTTERLTHGGFYIDELDILFCITPKTCLHEQAHRMDAQKGYISTSLDFSEALIKYLQKHPEVDPTKISSRRETYAQIYESYYGNIDLMPEEFEKFYR